MGITMYDLIDCVTPDLEGFMEAAEIADEIEMRVYSAKGEEDPATLEGLLNQKKA